MKKTDRREQKKMYFFENQNIGLRTLEISDVDGNYFNWFNDKDVCKYNSHHRYTMTKYELEEYVRKINGSRTELVLAVELKEEKVHIGNISLQSINYIDRSAEIAFLMGEKAYWNKGYATEAAVMLINHAFEQLGLQRIYFGTSEENAGMQKIGKKLNFKQEGIRRKALYKNGNFQDIYEYGLLKEEWDK